VNNSPPTLSTAIRVDPSNEPSAASREVAGERVVIADVIDRDQKILTHQRRERAVGERP